MSLPSIPSLSSLLGPSQGPSFFSQLKQASFGGVKFGVLSGEARFGRRQAIHEYPFRDKPWVEDLGKAARRINVTGFLLENDAVTKGGSVIAQRDKLIGVAEAPGSKILIHPTLGQLTVSLLDIAVSEKWDQGRYFEIQFTFIESGKKIFPSVSVSTGTAVQASALAANLAAAADFALSVIGFIHQAAALVQTTLRTVNMWIAVATSLVNDATNLFSMVTALPATLSSMLAGSLGRYAGGANTGFMPNAVSNVQNSVSPAATVQSLVALGVTARANVGAAASALSAAAASLSAPGDFAVAAQALPAALLAATVDPADGVRLLAALATFPGIQSGIAAPGWASAAAMQGAANDLFRRAAVTALASASATYQPSSSDDAVRVRTLVVGLLEAEILIAGNQAQDATFNALRALASAVTTDLTTRGGGLPALVAFTSGASLPAPVIAQMLYRDPGRAAELISEANAVHPAFMPTQINVLSS